MDLQFARSVLSRYLSKPRALHWDVLVYVVGYLRTFPHLRLVMDGRDMVGLPEITTAHSEALASEYGCGKEEVALTDPVPRGPELELTCMYDVDWAGCQATRRSVRGIVVYLGRTCIYAKSIRQCGVAASSFCSETVAGRIAAEIVMGYRNALRSFGIRIKPGGTRCYGDNLGQVQNISMLTSPLKKRHTSIAWHLQRWSQAIGACRFGKVYGKDNPSDFVSKANTVADFHHHMDSLMAQHGRLPPRLQGAFNTKESAKGTGCSPTPTMSAREDKALGRQEEGGMSKDSPIGELSTGQMYARDE